jgi:ABC-type sugar transport system ATPase subunit
MVQIVKAVSKEARVLLMDEPTSSLTRTEVETILGLVKALAGRGVGVVFVSHYLAEVFRVCDEITILREGRVVQKVLPSQSSLPEVIRLMIGRNMAEESPPGGPPAGGELLAVDGLQLKRKLKGISFSVREGEILGISGLMGSGASELAKAIFGSEDTRCEEGSFFLRGQPVSLRSTGQAIRQGIAYLPNDRKNEGLFARFPVADNVCIASIDRFRTPLGLLDRRRMARHTREYMAKLAIKAPDQSTPIENLSGGNQQKVLLGKWLETRPSLLILDEPTVGIDIGTKYEIRRIIREIAAGGVAIILISSELEELEKLCHRVLVMFRGEIARELTGAQIQKEAILRASMGE